MIGLLRINLLHVIRSRMLFFLFVFSFLFEVVGVRVLHHTTLNIQGIISTLDVRDVLFVGLVFQLFPITFLSAGFGIWVMPYWHTGDRAELGFSFPIPRWWYPLAYGLCLALLVTALQVITLVAFGLNFGFPVFLSAFFPWKGLLASFLLSLVASEVAAFAFACAAMALGQMSSVMLAGLGIVCLQVIGAGFRVIRYFMGSLPESLETSHKIYSLLPSFGDLVFELRAVFFDKPYADLNSLRWVTWWVVLSVLFSILLSKPLRRAARSGT